MQHKVTLLGNFAMHNYAHHWQGINDAFARLADDGQVGPWQAIDWRLSTGSLAGNPGMARGVNRQKFQETMSSIADHNPDVIIFCTGDSLNNQTLQLANDLGAFTALWFCDIREPERLPFDTLGLLAMTSGGNLLGRTAKAWGLDPGSQTLWLPQACLPRDEIDPQPGAVTDIIFIGSAGHPQYHRERGEMLQRLGEEYGRVGRFKWLDPVLDMEKSAITKKLPQLYQGSKVAFGHSDTSTYGYHSNRLFLAIGNGGFYFCNFFDGLDELFMPGHHLACYDPKGSWFDFKLLLDELIENDVLRERLRKQGFEHAQTHHTYPIRVRKLWAEIIKRM